MGGSGSGGWNRGGAQGPAWKAKIRAGRIKDPEARAQAIQQLTARFTGERLAELMPAIVASWRPSSEAPSSSLALAPAGPVRGRCPYCRELLAPKGGRSRQVCAAPDCRRRYDSARMRVFNRRFRARTGRAYRSERPSRTRTLRYCLDCGDRLWPGTAIETREICVPCGVRRRRRQRARPRLPRPSLGPWTAGPCAKCGAPFVSTRAGVRHCSRRCKRRAIAWRHKRRELIDLAKERPELEALIYGVFEARMIIDQHNKGNPI